MNLWQSTLDGLVGRAMACGAEKADALFIQSAETSLSCRHGTLEGLERAESHAVTLRAFVGESQACVSATSIDSASLEELARRAVEMARITPPDPLCRFAPEASYPKTLANLDLCDSAECDVETLFARAKEAEETALATPGITNSEGADASASRTCIALAIGQEKKITFLHGYDTTRFSLSASVLAGQGVDMQRDYDFAMARHWADLKPAGEIGKLAAKRALERMNPRKIKSGTMPVIYDRRVSRQLLSSFASAINGAGIVRGASFLRNAMGDRLFGEQITISDDPARARGLASRPFDGEGVETKPLMLVEAGELKSWLLDMRSATALSLQTTGHASRGMGGGPSPASTNLTLHAGTTSRDALIKSVKYGLLITETFGGGTNIVTGDYSQGASGFLIENGEVTSPVAEITLASHLRDMFLRAVPADDLIFETGTNAPSLFIDSMAVAGA